MQHIELSAMPKTPSTAARGYKRILLLIEWLALQPHSVALIDIVNQFTWPKSTALLLIRALVEDNYVSRESDGRYTLIRLPGEPSLNNLAWGTILRNCEGVLSGVVSEINETGFIAVLTPELRLHYLNKILPEREIRYDRNIEVQRIPHYVASGLMLLAGKSESDLERYLDLIPPESGEDILSIRKKIEAARKDGYVVNLQGRVEGAAGVAAPILDGKGHSVAAINISGPRDRLTQNLEQVIKATVTAAAEASKKLKLLTLHH
ncbi:helix-turn-helix domain-containing protein [Paenalcaligenes niemegkensis]|uniref:IclR family transcriptional regulator n=1 Tax=Paenalcaligenes niemegkensis TaxID=2895469 RepID=UPI001EE7D778|nr:IclR family transcriptional regulator C-terminal domain-containing protein [Paenalcaligenes niemegkensis]MCQ9616049.1 helix-turn-helix domain-containing protein [Paenalcaligenes niemegkensis]